MFSPLKSVNETPLQKAKTESHMLISIETKEYLTALIIRCWDILPEKRKEKVVSWTWNDIYRKLAANVTLTVGNIVLSFQGQEWAACSQHF